MINYSLNNSIKNNIEIIDFLNQVNDIKDFVCLPDFSVKEKYKNLGYKIDFPSSVAVITNKDKLYPQLNARGINCGMSLIKFSLQNQDNLNRIKKVLININKGFFYNLFYKYHLPVFAKYNLNSNDIKKVSEWGVDFLIDKYNLDSDIKKVFEENGRCELNFSLDENKFISKKWLRGPKSLTKRFGLNFAGNHFLELQKVQKIFDEQIANKYEFKKNDFCIMFHTAGLGLEAIANKDFVNKYIKKPELIAVKNEDEKKMLLDLYAMLMNFAYAYRLATYLIIKDEMEKEFGNELVKFDLITDVPHNSVRVSEDNEIVYRRNAVGLIKNKPSILAGLYNSASYLILPGENSNLSYYTSDHGSAEVLKTSEFKKKGTVDMILLKKGIKNKFFRIKKTIDYNYFNNPVVDYLVEKKIIRPVVKLRPIINLKYV